MRVGLLAFASVLALAACQGGEIRDRGTATGAGAGAVLGGVLGAVLDKNDARGVTAGAAAGAILGGAVGSIFDRQQEEFEDTLREEQVANEVEIERVRDDLLRINLANEVSFDLDSAEIRPAFQDTLSKLADVLAKYDRSQATVVGHTDSSGSDTYNQDLSERRAQAVVSELARYGVPSFRLHAEGRGESQPRAENSTAAGRQLNRRVEILVSPDRA